MDDILTIEAEDWTLSVWTKDITASSNRLQQTLTARDSTLVYEGIRLNPPINGGVEIINEPNTPIFFENKVYEFEFIFKCNPCSLDNKPSIKHKLKLIEESFHFTRSKTLRGSINFRNDIGWFKLRLNYFKNEKLVEQSISFQVFATKVDMHNDFEAMVTTIDSVYPLWRFALTEKTEHELANSNKPHERFPLLWLAHFTMLKDQLEVAIKRIINTPHVRLLDIPKSINAEKIRGRIRSKLEQLISEDFKINEFNKRYVISSKKLSIDTPENQFIKMVLNQSIKTLSQISKLAEQNTKEPDKQRLSKTFFDDLISWQKPLIQYLNRPFFREISDFSGSSSESLVLHQKLGYAKVYRIWQQLKLYLDVLGNNASVSMKSISELYEVWCLLEIRRILLDELGFEEQSAQKVQLDNSTLEKSMKDGIGAAFRFSRKDGLKVLLAHEPQFWFSDKKTNKILSYTTAQKPDIFIEAEFENGDTINWIFDAKYRIADDEKNGDLVPEDAINQMHRYRDALIYLHKDENNVQRKSRPVLGAYALYPGFIDESKESNYYQYSIDEVGIGAFPLLPGSPNIWLTEFLKSKLQLKTTNNEYPIISADRMYAEDSARIPFKGMHTSKYPDLTLLAITANRSSRKPEYMQALDSGNAKWFHTRCKTASEDKIESNLINEIAYVCPTYPQLIGGKWASQYAYSVISIRKVVRRDITIEQAGKLANNADADDLYWLFELGHSFKLTHIIQKDLSNQRMILTNLYSLDKFLNWNDLPKSYRFYEELIP